MGIERDTLFEGIVPISAWVEAARRTGGIREAERVRYAAAWAKREGK